MVDRRRFLELGLSAPALRAATRPPNVVLIYADDLGYGDLSCYGSSIATPHIDSLAKDGTRFTQFSSPHPICSPSRAALMTGRYAQRVGVPRNFGARSTNGMSLEEATFAQVLKGRGYRTMCVGKWHLGHVGPYHPVRRGFDGYFGIPYSNDMNPPSLLRDEQVLERAANMDTLSGRYAEEAVSFIDKARNRPFFLYHPHTFPHIPLGASARFRGRSGLGRYGDTLQEVDWGVGEILAALRRNGLEENTLVIFSSDNGPWYQGHPGPLRNRKGTTYEGGVRVPFLARWPGRIPSGRTCHGVASTLDLLPTVAKLCGAAMPEKPLDGADIWPLLSGSREGMEREILFYFMDWNAQTARWKNWKLHISRYNVIRYAMEPRPVPVNLPLIPPELYDLAKDPGESYDVAPENPRVVEEIRERFDRVMTTMPDEVGEAYRETMARKPLPSSRGAVPRTPGPR